MAPILAYWDIRGYAQPIRLLLAYTGTEFVDKYYTCGPPPNFDKSGWFNEKFTLGLDFPNLPYYIDGDVKLSQTMAIMRYLAMKHGLEGKDENEKIRIALIEQEILDYRSQFSGLCYNPEFSKLKDNYLQVLPNKLKALSAFLGNHEWFGGKHISYVDFVVYEWLDQHKLLEPNCLDNYSNLQQFTKRVESLPTIEKYMKSDKFLKYPLNNNIAKFGSRYSQ
ncbi:glutathione S-transferase-like protein [Leptotrombidium deliense]|uniref:Glutathione S-transferase n=1 Tax=Leptotrombidium deliense TaxID=299467 RepID=A0A443S7J6_9ACAR|nr:glutathione S-transferase-like protein [Leptotrombidium deliense]